MYQCPTLDHRISQTIENAVQKSIENRSEKLPHFYPSAFNDSGMEYHLTQFIGNMKPDEITLSQENGVLTIEGKNQTHYQNGSSEYQFIRRVHIPKEGNLKQMSSYLQNGNVIVMVPKNIKK